MTTAIKYEIPANILLAIAEKEGGKPGQWVRNRNGAHDIGPMQFNTTYLKELSKYGITAEASYGYMHLPALTKRERPVNLPTFSGDKAVNNRPMLRVAHVKFL